MILPLVSHHYHALYVVNMAYPMWPCRAIEQDSVPYSTLGLHASSGENVAEVGETELATSQARI